MGTDQGAAICEVSAGKCWIRCSAITDYNEHLEFPIFVVLTFTQKFILGP